MSSFYLNTRQTTKHIKIEWGSKRHTDDSLENRKNIHRTDQSENTHTCQSKPFKSSFPSASYPSNLPEKFRDTSMVVRMAPCEERERKYNLCVCTIRIERACVTMKRTLSFLLALNFFRHSTVSCLCIMEATVERCYGNK